MKLAQSSPHLVAAEKPNQPPVAIVIVGYRSPDSICSCLSALAKSNDRNFIISICENGGAIAYKELIMRINCLTDPSGAVPEIIDERVAEAFSASLEPHGQLIYVYSARSNLGFAGGVNLSIRQLGQHLSWSAIWLLNPDTEPAAGALRALVERARQGGYAIVGSQIILQSTGKVQLYGGRWRPFLARGFNIGMNAPQNADVNVGEVEKSMSYVSGASLYVTREYVESVGTMREDYFLYGEDVDWCFRRGSRRLGYAHNSLVYHAHGSTIGSNKDRKKRSRLSVYLDERNKLLFTRRFFPRVYPIVLVTALVLTTQYLFHGAFRNFVVALSGWLAGTLGEVGPPTFMSSKNTLE